MTEVVKLEVEERIALLTLNRPETSNALDDDVIDELEQHCAYVNSNKDICAVILTGEGKSFSSGGNIKNMRDRTGLFGGSPAQMRNRYREGIHRIPLALTKLEVPSIAAINGPAIGAGLDAACMCDIRIAANTAVFASSFAKVGIIPGDGGAWLLPRVVGMARASEMIFTGDRIDATTALSYGLISLSCPPEELFEEAFSLGRRIAVNSPQVLRMAKSLLREGQRMDLEPLLEMSAAYQAIVQHTADHREAVNAMFEKRSPKYTGE